MGKPRVTRFPTLTLSSRPKQTYARAHAHTTTQTPNLELNSCVFARLFWFWFCSCLFLCCALTSVQRLLVFCFFCVASVSLLLCLSCPSLDLFSFSRINPPSFPPPRFFVFVRCCAFGCLW